MATKKTSNAGRASGQAMAKRVMDLEMARTRNKMAAARGRATNGSTKPGTQKKTASVVNEPVSGSPGPKEQMASMAKQREREQMKRSLEMAKGKSNHEQTKRSLEKVRSGMERGGSQITTPGFKPGTQKSPAAKMTPGAPASSRVAAGRSKPVGDQRLVGNRGGNQITTPGFKPGARIKKQLY